MVCEDAWEKEDGKRRMRIVISTRREVSVDSFCVQSVLYEFELALPVTLLLLFPGLAIREGESRYHFHLQRRSKGRERETRQ